MRILQVHNRYRVPGGEDRAVEATVEALRRHGADVRVLLRDSATIPPGLPGSVRAFFSGIYCRSAFLHMARLIKEERPDVVHIHNVYPLISPSVLVACGRARVPVVMTCHNFRLICPTGELFSYGGVCERCIDGREYMCVLRNCRGRLLESIAYAARGMAARKVGWFRDNVAFYIVPTRFVADRLAQAGYSARQFVVISHSVPVPPRPSEPRVGRYAAFLGRISAEKGAEVLLQAAARCAGVPVRMAGDYMLPQGARAAAPANVQFAGRLAPNSVSEFYREARFLVVPSLSLETFSLAAAEAMAYGLPVIASRIGGLPEVVDDGVTGLLFEPGNADELADRMRLLWDDGRLTARLGEEGRRRALQDYSEDTYCARLTAVYERAISQSGPAGEGNSRG